MRKSVFKFSFFILFMFFNSLSLLSVRNSPGYDALIARFTRLKGSDMVLTASTLLQKYPAEREFLFDIFVRKLIEAKSKYFICLGKIVLNAFPEKKYELFPVFVDGLSRVNERDLITFALELSANYSEEEEQRRIFDALLRRIDKGKNKSCSELTANVISNFPNIKEHDQTSLVLFKKLCSMNDSPELRELSLHLFQALPEEVGNVQYYLGRLLKSKSGTKSFWELASWISCNNILDRKTICKYFANEIATMNYSHAFEEVWRQLREEKLFLCILVETLTQKFLQKNNYRISDCLMPKLMEELFYDKAPQKFKIALAKLLLSQHLVKKDALDFLNLAS